MLRSSLCNYSNTYILAKRTVTIANATDAYTANNVDKNVIFKNFAPFINCISRINNVQADYAHDIDVVMPVYNLIVYGNKYLILCRWTGCRC